MEIHLKQIIFLDLNLDLQTGRFWPYRKANSELLYVHAKSNHPPIVIKQLPGAITNRIKSLSCNKEEFDKALPAYNDALIKCGHQPTTTEPIAVKEGLG